MRIAIFSDNFYPELSGISDSVLALARTLARRGHFIRFYVPYYSEKNYAAINVPFRELDLGPNVSVHRLFSIPFAMGTEQGRAVIPSGINIRDAARFAPDVLHTQMYFRRRTRSNVRFMGAQAPARRHPAHRRKGILAL